MNSTVVEKEAPADGRALDVIVADDEPSDNLLLALAAQDAEVEMNFTFAEDGEVAVFATEFTGQLDEFFGGCHDLKADEPQRAHRSQRLQSLRALRSLRLKISRGLPGQLVVHRVAEARGRDAVDGFEDPREVEGVGEAAGGGDFLHRAAAFQ